jgi:HSP20 family protein
VYIAQDRVLVIEVELAGMRREDFELTIQDDRMVISGDRPDGGRRSEREYLLMEISYGSFKSIVAGQPDYDLSAAKAVYQNGILRIEVLRKQ